jgi:hypothetical protein
MQRGGKHLSNTYVMSEPTQPQPPSPETSGVSRRHFLKSSGIFAAMGASFANLAAEAPMTVAIILEPGDLVAATPPVQWAVNQLESALKAKGVAVNRHRQFAEASTAERCIVVAGADSAPAQELLKPSGVTIPSAPEALGLIPAKSANQPALLACGRDARGLIYALLELADRVTHAANPATALSLSSPIVEKPAVAVRCLNRLFVSEPEDKPWYNDREMWPQYFTTLAAQRFNRFHLALGIGYDFINNVRDAYFLFAYPFLLSVPGYNVRVPQLPDSERDHNLEMLKYISEQAVARGLEFHLGIWMHGYDWSSSRNANYTISGLTRETQGPYCRDALRAVLQACPAISGVVFRIHGESGVAEGSYDFWKTVFDGVGTCGRKVEIGMHAKGIDQTMIDTALATGMPTSVGPKYWAEHLGMSYQQASIRELEQPRPGARGGGLMSLSSGSRSFLRYSYGDLLDEKRRYSVIYRIWPGTQRLLVWGDPVSAAGHARAFNFCGSNGVDIMEPLSFMGRRGSGRPGDRCGYKDVSLSPRWDWQKYLYTLRIWGRLLYNPDTPPATWRRCLEPIFASRTGNAEESLANASRILPIITTVHGTSAGNNTYWPEMYLNQSMIETQRGSPYSDTPSPKVFGNVSPMDPQLFSSINEHATELLKGERSGKYSPIEAAQWIEDFADRAAKRLPEEKFTPPGPSGSDFRRLEIDVQIQVGLGRFFGAKFRSGVLYAIFEQTGERAALDNALALYRRARAAWAQLAETAKDVYQSDITVGGEAVLRGHWLDRLSAIDEDIAAMAKKLEAPATKASSVSPECIRLAIDQALGRPQRPAASCRHAQPAGFRTGAPLEIQLAVAKQLKSTRIYYRRVNQAERYQVADMQLQGEEFHAIIPAAYTDSPFPLQYYFELRESPSSAWLYPGFDADLANQPYFVVRQIAKA